MQVPAINIDLSGLGQSIVDALMDGLRQLASPLPRETVKWLLQSVNGLIGAQGMLNLVTHVPLEWTTQSAEVLALWRQFLVWEAGLGAVVLMVGGYMVSAQKIDVWYFLFRFGFLVLAGEAAAVWADKILFATNAVADSIAITPLDIREEMLPNDLVLSIGLVVAAFFWLLAAIKGVLGAVFIGLLLVVAPIVLTLSAIPFSPLERLGQWWATEFTKWTLRPAFAAIVLRLALSISITHQGGEQLLFAIVGFWMAYKMDTLMGSFSAGAWGSVGQVNAFSRAAQWAAARAAGPAGAAIPATAPAGP